MLSMRGVATMAFLTLALCGCPAPSTSYMRTGSVSAPPETYCLLERLRELSDGRGVTYIVEDIPLGVSHRFNYMRAKWHFTFQFVVTEASPTTVRHASGVANSQAEKLPGVRESMIETEGLLDNRCGLQEVMHHALESCLGVACHTIGLKSGGA